MLKMYIPADIFLKEDLSNLSIENTSYPGQISWDTPFNHEFILGYN
jgi:hypothetical protein